MPAGTDWYLRAATDVNDQGQVVGSGFRGSSDKQRVWRYTPPLLDENGDERFPAVIEETVPLSETDQRAYGSRINELGEVAATTKDASGVPHVWFFSDVSGSAVPVGVVGNVRGLNQSGQILVRGPDSDPLPYAIRVTLGGEPEYFYSECDIDMIRVNDINDSGHFVGSSYIEVPINKKRSTYELRAFRHDGK